MQSCGAVDSGECWGYHTSSWDNVIKTLGAPQRVDDCGETTLAERTEKCSETVKHSVWSSVAVDPWCEGRSTLIARSPCIAFESTPLSKLRLD